MKVATTHTTFTHNETNPEKTIQEAKRIVAIVTAAEDAAIKQTIEIIRKRIKQPHTCGHPKKVLSAKTKETNQLLTSIIEEIDDLLCNEIPF